MRQRIRLVIRHSSLREPVCATDRQYTGFHSDTCSGVALFAPGTGVPGLHMTLDPAPRRKLSADPHGKRLARLHQIPEYAVHRVFIEDADIAVGRDILLQGFQLDTPLIRNIVHPDGSEIWQPRFGSDCRVFRYDDFNFIARELVFPAFDLRQRDGCPGFRVLFGISPHSGTLA